MRDGPFVPSLQAHAEAPIVDPQEATLAAHDRRRRDPLNVLRHHADVDLVAPVVAVTVQVEAAVMLGYELDVALEARIRPAQSFIVALGLDRLLNLPPQPGVRGVPAVDGIPWSKALAPPSLGTEGATRVREMGWRIPVLAGRKHEAARCKFRLRRRIVGHRYGCDEGEAQGENP